MRTRSMAGLCVLSAALLSCEGGGDTHAVESPVSAGTSASAGGTATGDETAGTGAPQRGDRDEGAEGGQKTSEAERGAEPAPKRTDIRTEAKPGDCATLQYDVQNTGHSPEAKGLGEDEPSKRWVFDESNKQPSTPAVVGNAVYVVGIGKEGKDREHQHTLYALDRGSGDVKWSVSKRGHSPNASAPSVHRGAVYASLAGQLVAVSAKTGEIRWTVGEMPRGPVTVSGDHVYLSAGNEVVAIGTADGGEQWRQDIGFWPRKRAPAVADGMVYVGGNELAALSEEDGSVQWSTGVEGRADASPTVTEDTVYVGTKEGWLYAVSRKDGSTRWKKQVAKDSIFGVDQSVAVAGETVFVGVRGGAMYALEASDGSQKWKAAVEGFGLPVRAGKRLYVPHTHRLAALDPESGETLWKFQPTEAGGSGRGAVVTAKGGYIAAGDGKLYAIE